MAFSLTRKHRSGFSLIEVVLALGIMAFALTTVLGLLPGVLKTNKASIEESRAVNILTSVIEDLKSTPSANTKTASYNIAPSPSAAGNGNSVTLYFNSDQQEVADVTTARYKITLLYNVDPTANSRQPVGVYLKIIWPAAAATGTEESSVETFFAIPKGSS